MKKILIFGNLEKKKVSDVASELEPWLKERAEIINIINLIKGAEEPIGDTKADIGIVLGGDGAILAACRRLGKHQIPLVGVHLGSFGFLTELTLNELRLSLDNILKGRYRVSSRVLLSCRLKRNDIVIKESLGVNDVVISRPSLSRLIFIKLMIDGNDIATYRSDGIIVSTPIGSTAHNLAAGGPILTPDLDVFIITPICPHTLTNRPLVVPSNIKIELEEMSSYPGIGLTVDGQVYTELCKGDIVRVERSEVQLQLIDTRTRTFYGILCEKLHWAGHPEYAAN